MMLPREPTQAIRQGSSVTEPKTYRTIARLYDLLDLPFEHFRYRRIRPQLWQGLAGRVLDAGVGTGRNMPYYPKAAEMTGLDLSPAMLMRARQRRQALGIAVTLQQGNICATGFPDGHFDAVASSFLFCVLDDRLQLAALSELRRICKPGGEIRVLEYALSAHPLRRAIMRLWAPWVAFAYGARFDRNTGQYASAAGLEIVGDRFVHGDTIRLLTLRASQSPDRELPAPASDC